MLQNQSAVEMESRLSIEGRHIATRGHSQDTIISGQSRCSLLPDSGLCFYLEDNGQYEWRRTAESG